MDYFYLFRSATAVEKWVFQVKISVRAQASRIYASFVKRITSLLSCLFPKVDFEFLGKKHSEN